MRSKNLVIKSCLKNRALFAYDFLSIPFSWEKNLDMLSEIKLMYTKNVRTNAEK